MRILIVNPQHPSIGSRIPDDHLPPLGLLSIGGPLIDDGHQVSLFDGESGPASDIEMIGFIFSDIHRKIAQEFSSLGAKPSSTK